MLSHIGASVGVRNAQHYSPRSESNRSIGAVVDIDISFFFCIFVFLTYRLTVPSH